MSRIWFSTLFLPVIFLGAGCYSASQETSSSQPQTIVEENLASEETTEGEEETTRELAFEDGPYVLDTTQSSIAWNARKRVGAQHHGTVDSQEGALSVQQGQVIGGTIVADMTTIKDVDLTDADLNATLVNHLKSDDFFAVETYPTATFAFSDMVLVSSIKGTYEVTGTMTIKGIEQVISFPATVEKIDDGIRATGIITLDRTRWNVRYGSDKFFDNLGDALIEDEFSLIVEMVFVAST